jgi:hypothetical protein
MINLFIGNLGHLFVILSFVLSLASAFSYFQSNKTQRSGETERVDHQRTISVLSSQSVYIRCHCGHVPDHLPASL